MWSPSEDGGAFAECFFAQYPLGMGKKPLPPGVLAAITEVREKSVTSGKGPLSFAPAAAAGVVAVVSPHEDRDPTSGNSEELAQTTEKTREALQQVLQGRKEQEEDFSGRTIRRAPRKKQMLEIALPGDVGATGMLDPAPIVRSPTRVKKGTDEGDACGSGGDGVGSSSGATAVPFSIGNWKNKRKLIIPLEQRLEQQAESHAAGSACGISDHVMQLAVAMQQARKEVEAEQAAREKAQQDEEERLQAEREAEATRRARELLEKAAADMQQSSSHSRKETRDERLERIRLERELREREKQQEVRQRRLARAAARLGMTLEALEADEELLRTVDDTAAGLGSSGGGVDHSARRGQQGVASSTAGASGMRQDVASAEHPPSLYADDTEDGTHPTGGIRKGVFGSAVISNEGIRREMEALAKMEGQREGAKDGISLADEQGDSSDEDDDGGLGMDQFMKKKRRL
ncbi:SNW domain-containing protein 1 [Trypanosoma theileri]|uniref:SNW domain-containing protein 1 n=1 Tax=Trypanosoma theileri TaxID=67003 RepID=A0A1X0NU15_9TRYP|nr:SNW domain-containing protein 1 [Trypanosoma theileri]ORC88172.1 SNW domain-containing protein 1 [Trypanosoma theileri]